MGRSAISNKFSLNYYNMNSFYPYIEKKSLYFPNNGLNISNNKKFATISPKKKHKKAILSFRKCFCPIHGDQLDNEKHKCTFNNKGLTCISSLRYNCALCDDESGRSLSHIAFQKHLRERHSMNISENSRKKSKINSNINSTTQIINKLPSISSLLSYSSSNIPENFISSNYNKSKIESIMDTKLNIINNKNSRKEINENITYSNQQLKIDKKMNVSFNNTLDTKCINTTTDKNQSDYSLAFNRLQLVCAFELMINRTLEYVFHESYMSYDIPTKLMILKYALTDEKIICGDSMYKDEMIISIENLENLLNSSINDDPYDLEKELKVFLQFLINYSNENLQDSIKD